MNADKPKELYLTVTAANYKGKQYIELSSLISMLMEYRDKLCEADSLQARTTQELIDYFVKCSNK